MPDELIVRIVIEDIVLSDHQRKGGQRRNDGRLGKTYDHNTSPPRTATILIMADQHGFGQMRELCAIEEERNRLLFALSEECQGARSETFRAMLFVRRCGEVFAAIALRIKERSEIAVVDAGGGNFAQRRLAVKGDAEPGRLDHRNIVGAVADG
jgi:hypothetical protein